MSIMREYFFRRFGAGQPEVVKERERIYLLGMPNSSGEVFPPRINMEDKLDSLEAERDYLLDMCPKDKVDTYDPGKETTLVRILQSTLPKEYDQAQKTVMNMMRFRKASESGGMESITNLEDNVRKNYYIDWLPDYMELRTELINTWQLAERRRKEEGRRSKPGHPVLPILQGHDQPGPEQRPFGKREFKAEWEKESVGIFRKEKGEVREKVNLLESWEKETKETAHRKNRAPIGTEVTGFANTGRTAGSRTMDLRVEVKRRKLKLCSWPLRKGRKHDKS
jgi:hypothetical protein